MSDTNKNGSVRNLYDKDVLQHLTNIYDILGVTDLSELDSKTIKQKLEEVLPDTQIWVGPQIEYDEQWGNGTISETTLCIVTD